MATHGCGTRHVFLQAGETAYQSCGFNVRYFRVCSANLFPSIILHINSDSQKTKKHLKLLFKLFSELEFFQNVPLP